MVRRLGPGAHQALIMRVRLLPLLLLALLLGGRGAALRPLLFLALLLLGRRGGGRIPPTGRRRDEGHLIGADVGRGTLVAGDAVEVELPGEQARGAAQVQRPDG